MISRNRIDELIKSADEGLNITITLPTHKKGDEVQQDPIRFKNLLNRAEKILKEKNRRQEEIDDLLKQPRLLLDDYRFWNHADRGFAVYINPNEYHQFELPYSLPEKVYVNNHFLVTPLLPMISLEGSYNVLTVGQKNVRLLKCTRTSVQDVTPPDIFRDIREFIDEKPDPHLQFHTRSDRQDPIYFGHGANEEDKNVLVQKYLRGVEESVTRQMKLSGDPLVLVGTEENVSLYRSLNKYPRLLEDAVSRNPGE